MEDMQGTPENRVRLADLMNERRRELRIRWTMVARRAGMTPQNLLRIRKNEISITWSAADGIEDALQWQRGSVQAILEGGIPINRLIAQPTDPELRDDGERKIWAMTELAEDLRLDFIRQKRERQGSNQNRRSAG